MLAVLVVTALLLANAAFVAAEFAYVTVRRSRIDQLASEGSRAARLVKRSLRNLDHYVAASQLGITMATIGLGAIAEPMLAEIVEPPIEALVGGFAPGISHAVAVGFLFILINALHIIIGEFVPKSIALQKSDATAMAVAFPIEVFSRIFGPFIWLMNGVANLGVRALGLRRNPRNDQILGNEELAFTLQSSLTAGMISRAEFDLARHSLQLQELKANDLMVPRNEIAGIPLDASLESIMAVFARTRHTRYPVYQNTIDEIVGMLDIKDILLRDPDEVAASWRTFLVEPAFVPEGAPVSQALAQADAKGARMIILIDEYGGTAGMLSPFALVEHLAGPIPDEYDTAVPDQVRRTGDGAWRVAGLTRLHDLAEEIRHELPTDTEVETAGGLITETLGHLPEVGESIEIAGLRWTVREMGERRIDLIDLELLPEEPGREQENHDAD